MDRQETQDTRSSQEEGQPEAPEQVLEELRNLLDRLTDSATNDEECTEEGDDSDWSDWPPPVWDAGRERYRLTDKQLIVVRRMAEMAEEFGFITDFHESVGWWSDDRCWRDWTVHLDNDRYSHDLGFPEHFSMRASGMVYFLAGIAVAHEKFGYGETSFLQLAGAGFSRICWVEPTELTSFKEMQNRLEARAARFGLSEDDSS